jgi:hypothetical protein
MIRQFIARTIGKVYDTYALQLLLRNDRAYLPWTSSAVRPGAIACVLNDIFINKRETIVEFGSGISTLLISQSLDPAIHKLISFEHDLEWAKSVSNSIKSAGLQQVCEVIHAPLEDCDQSLDGSHWYDIAVVHNTLSSLQPDTVLCDGPVANTPGSTMARYPAIPVISQYLGDRFSIYLDDINRRGERDIAAKWGSLLGISFRNQLVRGSFSVGTKGDHFNSLI